MSKFERRLPTEVEAVRLIRAVYDSDRNKLADRGEWLLVDGQEQYYMKHEDFEREFVRKGPEKEVEYIHTTSIQSYPVYIEKPVPYPCPSPWIRPWWERGIVWCDTKGYLSAHPGEGQHSSTIGKTT
jgi:hypothetical protein